MEIKKMVLAARIPSEIGWAPCEAGDEDFRVSLEVRDDPTSMHLRYSLGRHSRLWEFGLLHSLW